MLAEIKSIASAAGATGWANTMLRAKNTLTAEDARAVESAFEEKWAGLPTDVALEESARGAAEPFSLAPAKGEDEAAIAIGESPSGRNPPIPKTVRHRNREHLQFVRTQPCLVCAKQPSDPHHLPFAQPRALGRKSAINTPCHCAAHIIARRIAPRKKSAGGSRSGLCRWPWPRRYGKKANPAMPSLRRRRGPAQGLLASRPRQA